MKRLLLLPLPPILPPSLRLSPTTIIISRHQSSSSSSSSWMRRHLKDPYVKASKKQELRSRAAFKLKEMQEKHHILKRGDCVIDLGCAPGGWSEVAAQLVLPPPAAASSPPSIHPTAPREVLKTGRVIGIDRLPMLPIQGVTFLQGDFTEATTKGALLQTLLPSPAAIEEERKERIRVDVILSDMSPDFMGDAFTDHRRCLDLCYEVMNFADEVFGAPSTTTTTSSTSKRKGKATILLKIFKGRDEGLFLSDLRVRYNEVNLLKPKASRQESAEQYVLARGWRRRRKDENGQGN